MRNRFAGHCLACGEYVAPGEGHPQKSASGWLVRCLQCVGSGNTPTFDRHITLASGAVIYIPGEKK